MIGPFPYVSFSCDVDVLIIAVRHFPSSPCISQTYELKVCIEEALRYYPFQAHEEAELTPLMLST